MCSSDLDTFLGGSDDSSSDDDDEPVGPYTDSSEDEDLDKYFRATRKGKQTVDEESDSDGEDPGLSLTWSENTNNQGNGSGQNSPAAHTSSPVVSDRVACYR